MRSIKVGGALGFVIVSCTSSTSTGEQRHRCTILFLFVAPPIISQSVFRTHLIILIGCGLDAGFQVLGYLRPAFLYFTFLVP